MAQDIEKRDEFKLLAELSARLVKDASVGPILPDRISRQGNRFTLRSATEGDIDAPNPHALDFVVVAGKEPQGRTYYAGAFNADVITPPTCRSVDSIVPDVDQPQSKTCASCKWSIWGSANSPLGGRASTACKSHKDLVIKVLGITGLWFLDIPPNSLRPWGKIFKHINTLMAERARNAAPIKDSQGLFFLDYVIRAEFEPRPVGTLKFKAIGYLGEAERPEVLRLAQEDAEIDEMLWGSLERKAQWERAAGRAPSAKPPRAPPELLGAPPEPGKPLPPGSPEKPPAPPAAASGRPVNGDAPVKRSRRADPRPGMADTSAALDAIFNDLGFNKDA